MNKGIRAILDDITGKREIKKIRGADLTKKSKAPLNKAYVFHYPNPKTRNRLDYWMEYPVMIIIGKQGDTVLGLSLQHLTYTYSIKLAREIARRIKNKKAGIKYFDVKKAMMSAKIPQAMLYFAIRAYKTNRIPGNVYAVEMSEYVEALKRVPRKSKKMGLGSAIKSNMAKYYEYLRKSKKKGK